MSAAKVLVVCRWPEPPAPSPAGYPALTKFPSHADVEISIDGKPVSNVGSIRFETEPGKIPRLFVEFLGAEVVLETPMLSRDRSFRIDDGRVEDDPVSPLFVVGPDGVRRADEELGRPSSRRLGTDGSCLNCGRIGPLMVDRTCRRGCGSRP